MREKNKAIGVFDSGLGGLTVVKALMKQLPFENIVYFGDTARVPYGNKSRESIVRFSIQNVNILKEYKIKMVVAACNSSSSYALPALKKMFRIPMVGVIHPGVLRAVALTENKRVGVIATQATISSSSYARMIKKADPSVKVISQACPLFVPLVEEGWFDHSITASVAREYLKTIKEQNADTVILGCTHYPLLKKTLKKVLGRKIQLIDSAQEVAQEVRELLKGLDLRREGKAVGSGKFLVSDRPRQFRQLANRFLGCDIKNIKKWRPSGNL